MPRNLASVQTVSEIIPIVGADRIELARIDGWQCVVKKGEFAAGDRALYFEIDAVPPDLRVFSFLWQPKPKPILDDFGQETLDANGEILYAEPGKPLPRPKSYRVRTIKLRGCLSQGLLLPLGAVDEAVGEQTLGEVRKRLSDANAEGTEENSEAYEPDPIFVLIENLYSKFGYSTNKIGRILFSDNDAMSNVAYITHFDHTQGPTSVVDMLDLGMITDVNKDLTALLGVTKYEPPIDNSGQSGFQCGKNAGKFPPFLHKTDETRVQGVTKVLAELAGKPYVMTVKLDGTSATYTAEPLGDVILACSRNLTIRKPENDEPMNNVYWEMSEKYGIEKTLRSLALQGRPYAVQGEIVGPLIQGNKLCLKEREFRAFNVYDINRAKYLDFQDMSDMLKADGIPMVTVEETGDSFDYSLTNLLLKAEGKYEGTKNEREGLVIRSKEESYSNALRGRMSFKAISNRFLLKGGD